MVTSFSISMRDRTAEIIDDMKGELGRSEFIEQCFLNYLELKKIKR